MTLKHSLSTGIHPAALVAAVAPAAPAQDHVCWIDTSATPWTLKVWDNATASWKPLGAAPSPTTAGGIVVVQDEQVLGVAAPSITLTPAGGQRDLRVRLVARNDQGSTTYVRLRFNADSGAHYDSEVVYSQGGVADQQLVSETSGRLLFTPDTRAGAGRAAHFLFDLTAYGGTTWEKTWSGQATVNWVSGGVYAAEIHGAWHSTAAIASITLSLDAGNFVAGTVATLYGIG